jgi:hypothetical protein
MLAILTPDLHFRSLEIRLELIASFGRLALRMSLDEHDWSYDQSNSYGTKVEDIQSLGQIQQGPNRGPKFKYQGQSGGSLRVSDCASNWSINVCVEQFS